MKPLSRNSLLTNALTGLVATPVFFQSSDQDTPAAKPQGKPQNKPGGKPKKDGPKKGKTKGKPPTLKGLGDVEKEAIKRIAKIDQRLADKLKAKLPGKNTKQKRAAYIIKRFGKLQDERTQIKGMEKAGISDPDRLKALKKLERELNDLSAFYKFGFSPAWYVKLLKERKKAKAKKQQPAGPAPTSRPVVTSRIPDGLLVTLAA